MAIGEFDLIASYFTQSEHLRRDVLCSVGDDAAIVKVPADKRLVISTDTFCEGTHFSTIWQPKDIAYKALAVALSDMAAMAAMPAWLSLSLSLRHADQAWLQAFHQGFFDLIYRYGLQLIGGDVVRGDLSVSVHVLGLLEQSDSGLRRCAAQEGDDVYLTGEVGAAGLAWQCLHGTCDLNETERAIVMPYLFHPQVQIEQGQLLRHLAHAAIDVSDGVAADLNHILTASGVGATIELTHLPLHPLLKQHLSQEQAWRLALSAGDDYCLCFTAPSHAASQLQDAFDRHGYTLYRIGVIESAIGLRCKMPDGQALSLDKMGFCHF